MNSLFIPELDGPTTSAEEFEAAYEWANGRAQDAEEYASIAYAESGWLRAAENNDQYAYEVEQDELRASAYAPVAEAHCVFSETPAQACSNPVYGTLYVGGQRLPACKFHLS